MIKVIDPHIHLINLQQGEYHWLKRDNPPFWPNKHLINRNFFENDLKLSNHLILAGYVHIEAGFNNTAPWEEIRWLEQIATMPFKSIAGIDLTLPTSQYKQVIQTLKQFSSVIGVRHILDTHARAVLSQDDIITKFQLLAKHNLHFELQMLASDLSTCKLFFDVLNKIPELQVIINHMGLPDLTQNDLHQWRQGLGLLSISERIKVKCSGWEMLHRCCNRNMIKAILSTVLDMYGQNRVMLAGNFPVNLLWKDYNKLWQSYSVLVEDETLFRQLSFVNAKKWYGFGS